MTIRRRPALPALLAVAVMAACLAPCVCAAMEPAAGSTIPRSHCAGAETQETMLKEGHPGCACPCMSAPAASSALLENMRTALTATAGTATHREVASFPSRHDSAWRSPAPPPPAPPLVRRI